MLFHLEEAVSIKFLKDIYFSMSNNSLDYYTKSHLEYCSKLIETVLDPKIQIN